jgi:DNA-binding NarL/FixJ family response regulator
MSSLRIVVVDDHAVVRRGVRALLESQPGWEISAEATTGRQAVEVAKRLQPDVVVMDLSLPELNGLDATRQILKESPRTEVLVLTMHHSEELARNVLQAGARGYILKSDAGRLLIDAIETLLAGGTFFTARMQTLVDGPMERGVRRENVIDTHLTRREREVLQLIAEGKSNKEIGTALKITTKTAETHRARLMAKLSLHSVADLVRYAIRNQIIEA